MLRKRYIIETINNMLKNMAQIVHSRHRSVNDFIMNLIYALGACCYNGGHAIMTAIVLFLLNCFFDTDVQATDYIFFS